MAILSGKWQWKRKISATGAPIGNHTITFVSDGYDWNMITVSTSEKGLSVGYMFLGEMMGPGRTATLLNTDSTTTKSQYRIVDFKVPQEIDDDFYDWFMQNTIVALSDAEYNTQFYPHRTVSEQANRLPASLQGKYRTTTLDRISIDGCEILGYFEYSFMEEKSYMVQPIRSDNGVIVGLDDYTTFLTPRLIIKYNMMNIDDYRKLMTFLNSKNTFKVTCYDVVADRRVTHEMYFSPPQMPIIYQKYLAALGVQDYTIELIGTNRRDEASMVTFYIAGEPFKRYTGETWQSFVLRGESNYKIVYSTKLNGFIVSKDNGETTVYSETLGVATPYSKISGSYLLQSL